MVTLATLIWRLLYGDSSKATPAWRFLRGDIDLATHVPEVVPLGQAPEIDLGHHLGYDS